MEKRRGLGASVAAAVVFSALLLSNMTILAASEEGQRLSEQANLESQLNDNAVALSGASAITALDKLQLVLENNSFPCIDPGQALTPFENGLTSSEEGGNVTVVESVKVGPVASTPDNLTILSPFNGAAPGLLDLTLIGSAIGGSESSGVLYHKMEIHYVNIPISWTAMVSLCRAAYDAAVKSVSTINSTACTQLATSSVINAAIGALERGPDHSLVLSVSSSVSDAKSCIVGIDVAVEQRGVVGPEGLFTVVMVESGSASPGGT